ncbi:MAG: CBS domain-containing protein [Gemmatimonadetes bacterium]|nr:CBS domain-containing protein [Gemmatimonadota bacterium]NIR79076.1 CBS domain-containing protein [Gemmatimonadota bacterium]NIT87731.1 CBS domain-containing protein [Gemmatimonadota bacterium]NIU31595.1 CBS domain-containing protein [Gemmatimonadota bacterium]NIU36239.1 CBS domain-containing protein [Gemmatimonadota bacterium]
MKLSQLLSRNRIVLPMHARDLGSAVRVLCERLEEEGALERGSADEVVGAVLGADEGDLIRINEAVLLGAARTAGVERMEGVLGLAQTPFRVDPLGGDRDATLARGLLLLLTPRRLATLRVQAIPTIVRYFRQEDRGRRLLTAERPEEIVALERMEDADVHDQLVVKDAMSPLQYRVYPDTPLEEVVDLMVRRELHAVPVVGESQEVLGIITAGDALKNLLPRRLTGEGERDAAASVARDVMTRSVLCVSEDQSLVEAANMMINKEVDQLPVVREGELVGFLTQETLLRQLFGS